MSATENKTVSHTDRRPPGGIAVKILLASVICPKAIEQLQARHEVVNAAGRPEAELEHLIADCAALVFRSGVQITAEVMRAAPSLRLIVRAGSGIDNIDLDYVQKNGLELVRVPGPGAQAVAEMSFALMLGLARQLLQADRLLREGHWAKHDLTCHLLTGKTLGVYGAGNIGGKVARMGVALGMRVLACVKHPSPEVEAAFRADGFEMSTPEDVLAESDFLSIHVPLNEETVHLFGAERLARMKPGAFLVNLARGGVVDEAALYDALESSRLAGAGVDVHEREGEGAISPLAKLPNVILTPHMGATTVDSQSIIGRRVVEIIDEADAAGVNGPRGT